MVPVGASVSVDPILYQTTDNKPHDGLHGYGGSYHVVLDSDGWQTLVRKHPTTKAIFDTDSTSLGYNLGSLNIVTDKEVSRYFKRHGTEEEFPALPEVQDLSPPKSQKSDPNSAVRGKNRKSQKSSNRNMTPLDRMAKEAILSTPGCSRP